jgi:hypothetical protein
MDGELDGLLRHRVRGLLDAAEGRSAQLVKQAEREACGVRRRAAADALEAISRAQADLAELQRDLAAMAAGIERGLGEPARNTGAPVPHTERQRTDSDRHRFTRASMRDRPVAALFAASDRG